jgi:hypothetical protein
VARHVSVELVDDIDGNPAAETVDFGLDGVHYTIDLSRDNAAQLRSALRPYLRKAREKRVSAEVGTQHRRRSAASTTALIRDLAERARDEHRSRDRASQRDTRSPETAPATSKATDDAETIIAHGLAADSVSLARKSSASLPAAPVFQPAQN